MEGPLPRLNQMEGTSARMKATTNAMGSKYKCSRVLACHGDTIEKKEQIWTNYQTHLRPIVWYTELPEKKIRMAL
jgi:hypothetical protein